MLFDLKAQLKHVFILFHLITVIVSAVMVQNENTTTALYYLITSVIFALYWIMWTLEEQLTEIHAKTNLIGKTVAPQKEPGETKENPDSQKEEETEKEEDE